MDMSEICPACGKSYDARPALSRRDGKTDICPDCGTREALEDLLKARKKLSPAERTRQQVLATGNRWAIENFNATH
mgnify:CR=1 FL=1